MNGSKRARTDDDIASSAEGSCTLSNGKGKVSKRQQPPPQSSDEALTQTKQAHGLNGPADRGCNIVVGLFISIVFHAQDSPQACITADVHGEKAVCNYSVPSL